MSFLPDMTHEQVIANASHLKALGIREVYLRDKSLVPWNLAHRCEPGCCRRFDIATSVDFYADCPQSGITLRWSFDIEPREANGSGHYQIDVKACREVMRKLNKQRDDAAAINSLFEECE